MNRRPAGRLAVVAVVTAALLAGCTAATRGSSSAGAATKVPLVPGRGGTATVAVDSVPTTLNDHTAAGDSASARAVASMVWAQVFQTGPKVAPALDTNVVQSAEVVSVAPQTVVYQIDPRAVWSDGTPVTAQDFVYAWLSQAGSARDTDGSVDSIASSAGYRDIASVVGSNAGKTVTVVFQTPFADWTSLFDDLLPAHVAERVGWNHGFDHFDPAVLVSAGPFVITSWTPGHEITFGRNPRWWGAPATLDRIVVEAVDGAPAMADALRSGTVQVAYPGAFDAGVEASVSSSPRLESTTDLGTTSLQLLFNVRRAPLDVTEVRQGIAHAVDRASIVRNFAQPLDPLVWEDNDHLFTNAEPWYADGAGDYAEPDPTATTRLLTTGGLTLDGRGTWTAHGIPVSLDVAWAADDPWSALVAPAVVAQLVQAGFDVESSPTSRADLMGTVLPEGAFDLALAPVTTGPYASAMAGVFGSPALGDGSASRNFTGFADPHVDALFVQAAQELAADQARQLYNQIDTALWTAMPSLPLFAEPTLLAWTVSLSSVRDDPGGLGPLWGVGRWAPLVAAPPTTTVPSGKGH